MAGRITQVAVEGLVAPTTQRVRATQVAVEVLVVPILVSPRAYAQVIG